MDRYATESCDFDRFPSPFDSGISRKILEISRKYGVSLSGSPRPASFSPANTQNLIAAIRKKYLNPTFPSVESPDWQVSDSESEPPMRFDEEVQTEKEGRDIQTQTEGFEGSNSQEKAGFRIRSWDIKRISAEKPESPSKESTGKPPLSQAPARFYGIKATSRPVSRPKLRNFEEFLQQHPISLPFNPPPTSLLDTDPTLSELTAKQRSILSDLHRIEAAKAQL